jgi:AAA ATPase domain
VDSQSTVPHSLASPRIGTDAARVALVERDHAWKLAAQAIGRARGGQGSALLFEGPPGIGKSGLLAAIRSLASESGTQLLTAAGRRREADFPFGVVLQLIETRLNAADSNGNGAWLAERTGPEPSFGQLHGLYHLCADLAAVSPLTLVIDDADLADPPSLRFLLYLAERLAELPVAVILAAGTVARRQAPELLGEIARHPTATRCRLEPLTKQGTARRLAKTWPIVTADEAAEEIHRASGGNPFLVDALCAALAVRTEEPRFSGRTASCATRLRCRTSTPRRRRRPGTRCGNPASSRPKTACPSSIRSWGPRSRAR